MASATLPVAVIGAGPIGLATAAELVRRDQEVVVLEQGETAAAAVRQWGHVRLFSPWSELTSPAAVALLEGTGWAHPDPVAYPTGAEWVRDYLDPLAAFLGERVLTGRRVSGVARAERDLLVDSGRADQPLVLHVQDSQGSTRRVPARAVVDCSGTWGSPNPFGAEGYPAAGESAAADRILYGMPDADTARTRFAGSATAVVGSGASALTALIALTSAPLRTSDSRVVWVVRRGAVGNAFGGGELDELPARGALGTRVRAAVDAGLIEVVTGFRVAAVQEQEPGLTLVSTDGRRVEGLDQIVGATGFRPDLSFLSEVRLDLDHRLQAPTLLAPGIDPNLHSCGSVQPHGYDVLAQPEGDLYLAGMKSYGRAPSFLAMTGYEQVRSIAAAIAGDLDAARAIELKLPDTGVCGGAGLFDEDSSAGGCCGTPAGLQELTLTVTAR
ncbi:FAD-dependent oxidoreductase [Ornithinimicrobium ciconiae]|uniref:FAD-dependent oxidoreductase n=1 Tax=Ornithinimicrobium ciconiae TaxID=2594265 RepID=A0A516G9U8_9MICO|nr:FAD-dependent oxidoreductase [Ornithinimicrobium ciconiae]QDO88298.1 FAD-dependent oxidoreductase [Ornithinimicrobium ciconiae]